MADKQACRDAIESPLYRYSRAGDRCFRGCVLIYHRDDLSPTGVKLACIGDADIVDPLIREIRNNSALSPTER